MTTSKIKIAHIINPFKCAEDNPSYLYYAQPITFRSMQVSQSEAKKEDIGVDLYAINYPEDDEIIPDYFIKLPHLTRSTASEYSNITNKKLPFVKDILESLYRSSDADYFIFTNVDIGVQKNFYSKVHQIIKNNGFNSFTINRRDDIDKFNNGKRLTENDLDLIYAQKGKKHPGIDCFVFNRELVKKINVGNLFVGVPPWGTVMFNELKKQNKFFEYTNEFLTFHLGKDKSWKKMTEIGKQNKKNGLLCGYNF
jgi:hypothetical protein